MCPFDLIHHNSAFICILIHNKDGESFLVGRNVPFSKEYVDFDAL